MRTPLSLYNLVDGGWRTVLSILGISIAVVLIFMQLGFLGAVLDTAVVFYRNLNFDLIVRSPDYFNFVDGDKFDRQVLNQVRSIDGIKRVEPFHVSLGKWKLVDPAKETERGILILGIDSNGEPFNNSEIQAQLSALSQVRDLLVDRKSRPQFLGEQNREKFSDQHIGFELELNRKRCQIAGHFELGTGLAANGAVIIDERGFEQLYPNYSRDDIGLGLVVLDAGMTPEAYQQTLINALSSPDSMASPTVEIVTRPEAMWQERKYWLFGTPIGFIFIAGVVIAFVVGAIIVYIVLSADISKQMGEYATLKAMGFRNSQLSRIVIEQAVILAVISYALAFGVSLILYRVVGTMANLPIEMTMFRQILVFSSSIGMSCISGVIAIQKLRNADPAELF